MRRRLGAAVGGAVAVTAGVAVIVAGHRAAPPITLASQSVTLPVDDGQFPAGTHADLVNSACTACHSASMALTQPPLTADQWKAEVTKMREAYHAPVEEKDVPAIVAYLRTLPRQTKPR